MWDLDKNYLCRRLHFHSSVGDFHQCFQTVEAWGRKVQLHSVEYPEIHQECVLLLGGWMSGLKCQCPAACWAEIRNRIHVVRLPGYSGAKPAHDFKHMKGSEERYLSGVVIVVVVFVCNPLFQATKRHLTLTRWKMKCRTRILICFWLSYDVFVSSAWKTIGMTVTCDSVLTKRVFCPSK